MKMSILVVDDSIINLSAVEQKLKDRYDVATANSGDKALRYLKNEKPDLILLDIKMDNMDGMETAKKLRNGQFQGFLIFTTVLKEMVFSFK